MIGKKITGRNSYPKTGVVASSWLEIQHLRIIQQFWLQIKHSDPPWKEKGGKRNKKAVELSPEHRGCVLRPWGQARMSGARPTAPGKARAQPGTWMEKPLMTRKRVSERVRPKASILSPGNLHPSHTGTCSPCPPSDHTETPQFQEKAGQQFG